MARPANADATTFRSGAEAVENGRKGGKASGKSRKDRKLFRDAILAVLSEPLTDKYGNQHPSGMTVQEAMIRGVINRAIRGDPRALVVVRDTIGEKPVEQININAPDPAIMAEIAERMAGDDP